MLGLRRLTWVEIKLFLREPYSAFFTLVFPVMLLLLFGSIYGNQPAALFGGRGTVDIMVPGYAALIIGTTGLMSLTITVTSYRERGILRRLRLTTLRPADVLLSQVAVLFVMNVLGTVLLVVVGKVIYGLHLPADPLSVLAAFLLGSLSFFALGFVLAGVAPTARAAQIIAMVIFYPMIFLSGSGMPIEILPASVRRISQALPLTYVTNLLRGAWAGESWRGHWTDVVVLMAVLVAGLLISARTFRWE